MSNLLFIAIDVNSYASDVAVGANHGTYVCFGKQVGWVVLSGFDSFLGIDFQPTGSPINLYEKMGASTPSYRLVCITETLSLVGIGLFAKTHRLHRPTHLEKSFSKALGLRLGLAWGALFGLVQF